MSGSQSTKKSTNAPRKKLDSTVVVAIIGLLGTIIAAIFASPVLITLIQNPTPPSITTTTSSNGPFLLTVQIWDVDEDHKNKVVASEQFKGSFNNGIPDDTVQEIGKWVIQQIEQEYNLDTPDVKVQVHVPANLTEECIDVQMSPQGESKLYTYFRGPNKSRIPFDCQSIKNYGKDFYLEIGRPGYQVQIINVKWGQTLDETINLLPIPVSIGVEEFSGKENSFSALLIDFLAPNNRLSIKDPSTLKALEEEIARNKELLGTVAPVQAPIRTSLGLDIIISGILELR
jgi:hypothetical protein